VINFGAIGFPHFNPESPLPGDDPLDPWLPSYTAFGCEAVCFSTVSQQAANDCAAVDAYLCQNGGRNPTPDVPTVFFNDQRACPFPCPDGTDFIWTVLAGTVVTPNQDLSNRIAAEIACARAAQFHLCLPTLQGACLNQAFSQLITMGGQGAMTFTITAGALPPGMSLTTIGTKTAVIAGTPTSAGTFPFTLTVQDPNGNYVSKNYHFQVLGVTPNPLPHPKKNSAYSQALSAVGGTGPYVFILELGALPDGLTLSEDGIISGTPTTEETSAFTISVQDSTTLFCAFDMSLTVDPNLCVGVVDWTNPGNCRLRIKGYVDGEFPGCMVCNPGGGVPWDGTFSIIQFPGVLDFLSDGTKYFSVSGEGFSGATLIQHPGNDWRVQVACLPGSLMVEYNRINVNPVGIYTTSFGCTGGEPATIELEAYSL
jgi:hypothetical protein